MGITSDIGDRLHLICGELTTANAKRYLEEATHDPAVQPCACPIPVNEAHDTTRTGLNLSGDTQTWIVRVYLGSMTERLPGQNIQRTMEAVIDEMRPLLLKRTRLENSSLDALNYIMQSMYQGWSFVPRDPITGYAYVDFRLLIRHQTVVPLGT